MSNAKITYGGVELEVKNLEWRMVPLAPPQPLVTYLYGSAVTAEQIGGTLRFHRGMDSVPQARTLRSADDLRDFIQETNQLWRRNDNALFRSEWFGTWEPDVKLEAAVKRWRNYYAALEQFENKVKTGLCFGRLGDKATRVAANPRERELCNRMANIARKLTLELLYRDGVDTPTSERGRRLALRDA